MLIPLEAAGFSPALSVLSLIFSGFILTTCGFLQHNTHFAVHQKTSGSAGVLQTGVDQRTLGFQGSVTLDKPELLGVLITIFAATAERLQRAHLVFIIPQESQSQEPFCKS